MDTIEAKIETKYYLYVRTVPYAVYTMKIDDDRHAVWNQNRTILVQRVWYRRFETIYYIRIYYILIFIT